MAIKLLLGSGIFALNVVVQVVAVMALVYFLQGRNRLGLLDGSFWFRSGALSGAMLILFAGHLLQVSTWALLFKRLGQFEDFETAFYHSAVNFSSLGYGDIVMQDEWRILGALEAAGGILMFGLSTGLGFAVINKYLRRPSAERVDHPAPDSGPSSDPSR